MEKIKVALPSDSSQNLGGGFSFRKNFIKGLGYLPRYKYCEQIEDSDICLVASTSMVTRQTIDKIKELGKKLVVRNDGVPRNSRNRNTGTSRLEEFNQKADGVVYQCEWARKYLSDFIGRKGVIIYNGVDTEIFHNVKEDYDHYLFDDRGRENYYLYSRFNRDETKNWEVAWYEYQLIQRENKNAKLIIVGKFSPEHQQYNFDFFQNENYEYLNVIQSSEEMAKVYRSCGHLLATYYNDAYSNTYLEAIACGLKLHKPSMTGGTPELIKNGVITIKEMAKEYEKLFERLFDKS